MDIAIRLPFRDGLRDRESPVLGPERQQLADLVHGTHYQDCLRGRVFSQASTPLGLAIPIYTATALAGGMPIWNPVGSGVNVELISVDIAYASGTADYAALGLMAVNVGTSAIGTGTPITAFAETTPKNGLLYGGVASRIKSSNAGTVTVTAQTAAEWARTLMGINLEAQTGTAHATQVSRVEFDGTVIVPPGVLVFLAATKATTALYASAVVWKEIPIAA